MRLSTRCRGRLLPSLEPSVLTDADVPATLRRIDEQAITDSEQLGSQRLLDRDERVRPTLAGRALGDESLVGEHAPDLVEPIAHAEELASQIEVDVSATGRGTAVGNQAGPRGDATIAEPRGGAGTSRLTGLAS